MLDVCATELFTQSQLRRIGDYFDDSCLHFHLKELRVKVISMITVCSPSQGFDAGLPRNE